MKFTFTEKKMGSSDSLRAYAEKKIGKLDRLFKTEAEATVTFSMERGRYLAEITIHNNGLYYRASELTNDMYASVDSGVAAIERQIRRRFGKLFFKNILFCLLFFVLIPGVIYYLSYYPYALAEGITSPFDRGYAQIVLENQKFMFTYHSGVTAEHPYASRWYQWILDIRPILYYLKYYPDGSRSSFGAWVNPVLCWAGLLALFVLVYMALARRDKKAGFLLIGYLAQLLPWVFISRITFEYHYFPSAVFLILALGYVFSLMGRRERWRVLGLTGLCVVLFLLFYPALSGLRVDNSTASALLQWLPTWPF